MIKYKENKFLESKATSHKRCILIQQNKPKKENYKKHLKSLILKDRSHPEQQKEVIFMKIFTNKLKEYQDQKNTKLKLNGLPNRCKNRQKDL
jgi:hypothetical protein